MHRQAGELVCSPPAPETRQAHIHVASPQGISFMSYKENKERNVVILLINREVVQLATLELHPLDIKVGFFSFHLLYWIVWKCFRRGRRGAGGSGTGPLSPHAEGSFASRRLKETRGPPPSAEVSSLLGNSRVPNSEGTEALLVPRLEQGFPVPCSLAASSPQRQCGC